MLVSDRAQQDRMGRYLGSINADDGIDADEAQGIASAYFLTFISACGGPDHPVMVNGEWSVPLAEGFAGRSLPNSIRIDPKSGAIRYLDGPSFSSFRRFQFALTWGAPAIALVAWAKKGGQ
jgi:hypothetical protein